ncbi:MAG TPA: hypothetical protein PLS03_04405 [Terrimicrobiaceae bacterium]|nr:hypothetical protein [Terrimicrobiaceae bacterium]
MASIGKILFRSAPAILTALWMTSCAQRPGPAGVSAEAAAPAPTGEATVFQAPKSRAVRSVSLSGPPEKDVAPAMPTPSAPSPSEQIAALVRNGSLVESGRGLLVFSRAKAKPRSEAGLYEDAILLAGLRRQLMAAGGLPPSIAASATIHASEAFLKLDPDYSPETCAKAIDAALKTAGVTTVNARLAAPVRL